MYWYQLVDWYAATFCVAIIGFFECISLAYFYGTHRFYFVMIYYENYCTYISFV